MDRLTWLVVGAVLCQLAVQLSMAEERHQCPTSSCPKPQESLDLSPLQGTWDMVYFRESELGVREPRFFNLSLCGSVGYTGPSEHCQDSSLCYSQLLNRYYSLGTTASCHYSYSDRKTKLYYTYSEDSSSVFGHGNVTVTLVCGRSLGVPEVVVGDPADHTIEILWVTSAACKTDSSLATVSSSETKCYTVHSYEDDGVKAKMIDLSNLIQTSGYEVTHPETKEARFLVSVCRPIQSRTYPQCNGSMACLIHADPNLLLGAVSLPLKLASINGTVTHLRIESDFPTVEYVGGSADGCGSKRRVKVIYQCPTDSQSLGPTVSYLDNHLCLIVVTWHTYHACGVDTIQSTGCTLTSASGLSFDLTGLSDSVAQVNGSSLGNHNYTYAVQLCSGDRVNTQCGILDAAGVRVAQIDYQNHGVCRSLGTGKGKLRYVDGTLSLTYDMGDSCHSNFHRTSIINFVCPEEVKEESATEQLRFLSEDNCLYEFEWTTPLACGTETAGTQNCHFELNGNEYNFAPLVGESDKNWVALVEDEENTECYMVNPCGQLFVTEDTRSAADYCNDRVAPKKGCVGCSVCKIHKNATTKCIGTFDLQNSLSLSSIDKNVLTVRGDSSSGETGLVALMHYVCKTGDFTTPPVFVAVTNDRFYEFHWMTMAACPLGIHQGDNCAVRHETTGYIFNMSSLSSSPFSFDTSNYHYDVSVCKPLNYSCNKKSDKSGACQKYSGHQRLLGEVSSTLTYSDGTLFLQYGHGDECSSGATRNTTVLLMCDSQAHKPSIAAINEVNHCQYAVELHTKHACPPSYQATECIHFDQGHTYDFSELSKSVGNWQAEGADGSIYYINLCQPLNKVAGCSPLSAVCRSKHNAAESKTEFTNLGSASSVSFKVTGESGIESKNRVVLSYSAEVTHGACKKIYSRVEFICSPSAGAESGPVFQSGGDEANPCEYSFTWETPGACPILPSHSSSCSVPDPESGRVYDLSPLADLQNHFTVTSDDGKYHWDIAVCGGLNYTCHGSSSQNASVCQSYDGHQRVSGLATSRLLQFFDGALSLRLSGGEKCNSNGKNRSALINFECDKSVLAGTPRYVEEVDCEYSFVWPTLLACPRKELECVADGGRYDLRPLLHYKNYMVTTSSDYSIVVGGCSGLELESLPHCPKEAGMGACRYSSSGSEEGGGGGGEVMGYLIGDIVEEVTGVLRLSYYNGAKCAGSGRSRTVNIFFQCEKGAALGVPMERDSNEETCVTNIDWLTQYACPLDMANPHGWNVTNPVTHQNFDLRTLSPTLSAIFVENSIKYNYTLGLGGHHIECGKSGMDYHNPIGACQTRVDTGKAYILGRVNNSVQLVGDQLRAEYHNGNFCHHANAPRRAVLTFICNKTSPESGYLEVLPEEECEYTFNVHTPKACPRKTASSVECYVAGYAGLRSISTVKVPPVSVPGSGTAYVAVCGPLSRDNQVVPHSASACPYGAAACLIRNSNAMSLGEATTPPTILKGGQGVVLQYSNGDKCKGDKKWKTTLILSCDKDTNSGVIKAVLDDAECSYTFTWPTAMACPEELFNTDFTDNMCSFKDPLGGSQYNFKSIASKQISVPNSDTTYHLRLCGTMTNPPSGCGTDDVGICREDGKGKKVLVSARHKIVIVSHAPHIFEVVYDSGEHCSGVSHWTAVVSLVCKWHGGTEAPVFVSDKDCVLRFVWKSSLFCDGHEICGAEDKTTGYTYDLDSLLGSTWSGLVRGERGSFDMGICRSLNPFSPGHHCHSPAGICWHKSSDKQINLGQMKGPPVYVGGDYPHIQLNYTDGDDCNGGQKHSTIVSLTCGPGTSSPLTLESNGECTHTLDWETPYACRPKVNHSMACVWNDTSSGLLYNLSSLAKPTKAGSKDLSIDVCLCPSDACTKVGGAKISAHHTPSDRPQNWGQFHRLSVSSANSAPVLSFTNGDICTGTTRYMTYVYMECDRSIATDDSKPHFQEGMSRGCTKVFFWSTPFACHTKTTSCTHTVSDRFFDFTPLHSNPGEKAWRVSKSGDDYYVNVCGSISDYNGCDPGTAICVHTSDGNWQSIGMAATQEIISTTDDSIQIKFTGHYKCRDSTSKVVIDMVCGLGGLILHSVEQNSCTYDFTWTTPYACHVDSVVKKWSECRDDLDSTEKDGIVFHPNNLKTSGGMTVKGGYRYGTFHISLCGPNTHCGQHSSVCYTDSTGQTHDIASSSLLTIITQGTSMWMEMNATDSLSHVIVNVECVTDSADISRAESMELEKVTTSDGTSGTHTFYHFTMWTERGCSFPESAEAPPTSTTHHKSDQNGGDHSGSSSSSQSGTSSTVVGLLVTLVVLMVVAILLGFVFYKKDRRDRLFRFFKTKSSEPVRYEKLPMTRTEETSLLEEGSSGSDGGMVSGEDEEGGGEEVERGERRRRRRLDQDEELINL